MAQPDKIPSLAEILAMVRRFRVEMDAHIRRAERDLQQMDDLKQEMLQVETWLAAKCGAQSPEPPTTVIPKPYVKSLHNNTGDVATLLEGLAMSGVDHCLITPLPHGAIMVKVDAHSSVKLPSTVARLMEIMVQDNGGSTDALVDWKSYAVVAREMGKNTNRHFNRHSVTQLVSRLRRLLNDGGVNPYLAQTDPQKGLRFALRRKQRGELQ